MKLKPIVILGAGGLAREVMWVIELINASAPTFEILGYLDDDAGHHGLELCGVPVLGGFDWIESCGEDRLAVAMGVGSPRIKRLFERRLNGVGVEYPTLISPDAHVSRHNTIDEGAVITTGCVLTVDIHIGAFTLLNLNVTVGHDAVLARYCTVNPGTTISGHVTIGEGCDVGTNATIIQGKTLGEGCVVGAGASVVKDLPANTTAVGVPARVIKELTPWELR